MPPGTPGTFCAAAAATARAPARMLAIRLPARVLLAVTTGHAHRFVMKTPFCAASVFAAFRTWPALPPLLHLLEGGQVRGVGGIVEIQKPVGSHRRLHRMGQERVGGVCQWCEQWNRRHVLG